MYFAEHAELEHIARRGNPNLTKDDWGAFLRANEEARRTTGLPIIDIKRLYEINCMRKNPGAYDTRPPPAPEGFEHIVDIKTGKSKLALIENDEPCDYIDATEIILAEGTATAAKAEVAA